MTENRTSKAVDLLDDLASKQNNLQLSHPQASLSVSVPVETAWAIAEKYRKLEGALRELEWSKRIDKSPVGLGEVAACPYCLIDEAIGHDQDCIIGKALAFDPLAS